MSDADDLEADCAAAGFGVRQTCGDRDRRPHEANLFDPQAEIGDVVCESEAIAPVTDARRKAGR